MARLKTPDTIAMTDRQRAVHDAIASGPRGAVVGPLGVWLHRAELADKAQRLGQYCRARLEPHKVPMMFKVSETPLHTDRFKKNRDIAS